MGQSVDVVVSELHSAAARLEGAGQRLQDGLSSVDLEVGQLMGSGWQGGAASAYDKAWDQWHGGAGQVVRGLQTMSQLLTVAGKEYAKIDEQGAAAMDSQMQTTGDPGGSGSTAAGQGAGPSGTGQGAGGSSTSAGGSASSADGVQGAAQSATSPLSQLGQVLQPLTQSGQAAAGVAQLAAQMALGLTQAVTSAAQDGDDESVTDGAAPSDEQSAAAPVETPRPGSQSAPGGSRLSGE